MMTFRLLEEGDLETRVDWMNDPLIYKSMHYDLPISIENTKRWFTNNKNNESRVDFVLEDGGDVVVMCGLTGLDQKTKKVESYTMVNPSKQGMGYGSKALALACAYAFDIWNINKVWAYTDSDNIASQRTYQKNGFKLEGTLRNEVHRAGEYINRLYFGLLPEDFNRELYNIINLNCNNLLLP